MNQAKTTLAADFPLSTIGTLQKKLYAPESFDPNADWTLRWGVYSTPNPAPSRVGELRLSRRLRMSVPVLEMRYDKQHIDGRQRIEAVIEIDELDELAWPERWEFQARVETPDGEPIADTRIAKKIFRLSDTLHVEETTAAGAVRKYEIEIPDADHTLNWALFAAVMGLPREKLGSIAFTLIDHFDQVKPEQTIAYRDTIEVPIGGATRKLAAFDQLGRGNLPFTWYVDERGCPIVVIAGIEAYVLEPNADA